MCLCKSARAPRNRRRTPAARSRASSNSRWVDTWSSLCTISQYVRRYARHRRRSRSFSEHSDTGCMQCSLIDHRGGLFQNTFSVRAAPLIESRQAPDNLCAPSPPIRPFYLLRRCARCGAGCPGCGHREILLDSRPPGAVLPGGRVGETRQLEHDP